MGGLNGTQRFIVQVCQLTQDDKPRKSQRRSRVDVGCSAILRNRQAIVSYSLVVFTELRMTLCSTQIGLSSLVGIRELCQVFREQLERDASQPRTPNVGQCASLNS